MYYETRTEKGFSDILLCTIDHQDIKSFEKNSYKFNQDHKPIPMSKQWHKRFGVEGIPTESAFRYELPSNINLHVNVEFLNSGVYLGSGHSSVCIWDKDVAGRDMYVHEWQNLYNSLTGEKLKKK